MRRRAPHTTVRPARDYRIGRRFVPVLNHRDDVIKPACVRVSSVVSLAKPINSSLRNARTKKLVSRNVVASFRMVPTSLPK